MNLLDVPYGIAVIVAAAWFALELARQEHHQ